MQKKQNAKQVTIVHFITQFTQSLTQTRNLSHPPHKHIYSSHTHRQGDYTSTTTLLKNREITRQRASNHKENLGLEFPALPKSISHDAPGPITK